MHMASAAADGVLNLSQDTINSNGARSIYSRGPGFSLDPFSSRDFIVKDFVESLSDGSTQTYRRSALCSQAFDPKPYIRNFEHGLARLIQFSEERETHENELSSAVRRAEGQHKQHCVTLQVKLDQSLRSFNNVENGLEASLGTSPTDGFVSVSGGHVALQIGERLEELDSQRQRADDAKFLIQCWQDISERGDLSHLEDIRRLGGGEGKVRCARIARQLLKISGRIGNPRQTSHSRSSHSVDGDDSKLSKSGAGSTYRPDNTVSVVEKFLERLEKDLLERFDECRRQHNENGMRDCATALYDFGDGASVIASFVNQHEFFIERNHVTGEESFSDRESWDRLADPDAETVNMEISLQSLVDEVKLVLQEESVIIKRIFPFYEQVLITFLQRVFVQSIQQRLEIALEKANLISPLAFLRTLQAARNYIWTMVDELKTHGLTEHPDAVSPHIASVLDQQLEDCFVPYLAGSSYVDTERRSLEELYTSLLFKFTLYHSKRRKGPTTYLVSLGQRGRELLSAARDTYMDRLDSSDLSASRKALLLKIAGLRDIDSRNKTDIEVSDEDGVLSLPIAKRMLKWLAECIGRGLELSGGSDTTKDIAALLKLLLTTMGDIYLDTALEAATEIAVIQESSKSEPELHFIQDLQTAINIIQIMLSIANTVLLPLASPNLTVRRELGKLVNATISRMEEKISALRTRTIDVALGWVIKLLSRQNRGDFKPRDDEIAIEQLQTSTCLSIFSFLSKLRDLSLNTKEGKNLEPFFTDLAMGLRSLLFDHFRKFQVNLAGGLMVSKDIAKYIELLRTFPTAQSFQPSLEVLIEIGNIFVISPEALKDRLRSGNALTNLDKTDLRPYIQRREDAGSIGILSVLNSL